MSRPAVRLTLPLASHLHDLLSGVADTIGEPAPANPLGLQVCYSGPMLRPVGDVLARRSWADVQVAVYIVTTATGHVLYVGSIDRTRTALPERLRAHFAAQPERHGRWTHIGALLLPSGTPHDDVLLIEGLIGRSLDPIDNGRLPGVPGRDAWRPRAAVVEVPALAV